MKHVKINDNVVFGNDLPFVLIAGPCQMESRDHALFMAENLAKVAAKLNIPYVFKASFDKANRTSLDSRRGLGLEESMPVFAEIKKIFGCPTTTDIHESYQAQIVAQYVDILQIPSLLSRQTDLLVAAAKTGKPVNIKKIQAGVPPSDVIYSVEKVSKSGNDNVMVTERGTCFGYGDLVVDMRGLPQMAATGYPVIIDAGHPTQRPYAANGKSGGDRRLIPALARAAIAVGVAGVFVETHDNPEVALSDGPNMMKLADMEEQLCLWKRFDEITKQNLISLGV